MIFRLNSRLKVKQLSSDSAKKLPDHLLLSMGCCFSAIPPPGITAQELELYEAWTFFSKKEIVA